MLVIVLLMFLPFAVAVVRGNRNTLLVLMVNLFLGWTIIGWFVALMMALSGGRPIQQVVIVNLPEQHHTRTVKGDWVGSRRLIPLAKERSDA